MDFVPPSSVHLDAIRSERDPMGTIALPVRDLVTTSTMMAILATQRGWTDEGIIADLIVIKGNILTLQRNALVQAMRGDWLLFIDDDMVWKPDDAIRLIRSLSDLEESGQEADVLGALCFRRQDPYQPTLYVRYGADGPYNYLEDWEGRYIEVDATGMAFALVTKRCFERIAGTPMPSYEERMAYGRTPDFFRWQASLGEDLRFCQDVRAAGGRIIIDTSIEIDHIGEARRGYDDFLRAVASREPEMTEARRSINREMGLPMLSRAEAGRRLRARRVEG